MLAPGFENSGQEPQGAYGDTRRPRTSFAFDQNVNSFHRVQGDPALVIAQATITLERAARVKVEAVAGFQGSVANGRGFITAVDAGGVALPNLPIGSQSFSTTTGTNFRTCNLVGITDVIPAGTFTVKLTIEINGAATSTLDSASATLLMLTEL